MLDAIEAFLAVVETGSFSAAGRKQGRAPSSISRAVQRLESELGCALLYRNSRNVRLSPAGERFVVGARASVAALESAIEAVAEPPAVLGGWLRVSVFSSFGGRVVIPSVPEFLRRHPKLQMEVDLDDRPIDLLKGRFDLAIRIGRPRDSALKWKRLSDNHLLLVASPGYLRRAGAPTSPTSVAQHPCLRLGPERKTIQWYFRRGGQRSRQRIDVPVTGPLVCRSGEPLRAAALEGLGLALLPRWMVGPDLTTGRLVALLTDWEPRLHARGNVSVYALYAERRPAITTFLTHLQQSLERSAPNPPS